MYLLLRRVKEANTTKPRTKNSLHRHFWSEGYARCKQQWHTSFEKVTFPRFISINIVSLSHCQYLRGVASFFIIPSPLSRNLQNSRSGQRNAGLDQRLHPLHLSVPAHTSPITRASQDDNARNRYPSIIPEIARHDKFPTVVVREIDISSRRLIDTITIIEVQISRSHPVEISVRVTMLTVPRTVS